MSILTQTDLLRDDLARIVRDIFLAMLAMEVEVDDGPMQQSGTPVVTASMHLGGGWNGAVLLQCGLPAACAFAAAMLGIEKPDAANDDVKDVMGELINMVAGNFKSLLEGGASLSMPTVVEGADYRFRILRGQETAHVGFRTPAGPLYVKLVELSSPAAS